MITIDFVTTILVLATVMGLISMLCIGIRLFELCVDIWEYRTGKSLAKILRPWDDEL